MHFSVWIVSQTIITIYRLKQCTINTSYIRTAYISITEDIILTVYTNEHVYHKYITDKYNFYKIIKLWNPDKTSVLQYNYYTDNETKLR